MVDVQKGVQPDPIDRLFPPRKDWLRTHQDQRKQSPVEENVQTLRRTVMTLRKDPNHQADGWLVALNGFIDNVRSRALRSEGQILRYDKIELLPKENEKNRFRPITIFSLEDRVIDCLVSRYLRHCFDPDFSASSYAFRVSSAKQKALTHHDAFQAVINYHERHSTTSKWVAECDLEAFFDCIDQNTARQSFAEAIEHCSKRGVGVDLRARAFFNAYLDGYDFSGHVNNGRLREFKNENPMHSEAFCKWPDKKLRKFHGDISAARIGVPQGGAMSCLIANLVLDSVDRAVLRDGNDEKLFYARYCDDMVIIHTDEQECRASLERYLAALQSLKLPVHQPEKIERYSAAFWKAKSKEPFCWTNDRSCKNRIPWISFVGYQLHYNGLLRIRPKSIQSEMDKHNKISKRIRYLLKDAKKREKFAKISAEQIFNRVRHRFISMAVGRRKLRDFEGNRREYCWISGFSLLGSCRYAAYQLRWLDRSRGRVLARLAKQLRAMGLPERPPERAEHSSRAPRPLPYYGYPYSYAAQFKKSGQE